MQREARIDNFDYTGNQPQLTAPIIVDAGNKKKVYFESELQNQVDLLGANEYLKRDFLFFKYLLENMNSGPD